jgi:hypothetical protein
MPPFSALQVDLPEDTVYYPAENGLDLARKSLPHVLAPEQPADDASGLACTHANHNYIKTWTRSSKRLTLRQKKKQLKMVAWCRKNGSTRSTLLGAYCTVR